MIDPRPPRYEWGQAVIAAVDLYNDGSHPDAAEDALLVAAGGPGEIVQIGHHAEANVPVYMVDFGVAVIGCLEEEIAP
jgi:nitrogen fixation protein NifZ